MLKQIRGKNRFSAVVEAEADQYTADQIASQIDEKIVIEQGEVPVVKPQKTGIPDVLTYRQYQILAKVTATFNEEVADKYCRIKLIGEVGELLNLVGKTLRGDYTLQAIKEKITDELGDILWYATIICDRAGKALPDEIIDTRSKFLDLNNNRNADELLFQLAHTVASIPLYIGDVYEVIYILHNYCKRLDIDMMDVAVHNLRKLEMRVSQGTLKGHNRTE